MLLITTNTLNYTISSGSKASKIVMDGNWLMMDLRPSIAWNYMSSYGTIRAMKGNSDE